MLDEDEFALVAPLFMDAARAALHDHASNSTSTRFVFACFEDAGMLPRRRARGERSPMHCVGIAAGSQAVFGCAADETGPPHQDALVFAWPSGQPSAVEARMQSPRFWTSDDGAFMTTGRFECPTCGFSRHFDNGRDARPMYVRDRYGSMGSSCRPVFRGAGPSVDISPSSAPAARMVFGSRM
jgi:hypothetical protein